jgi:L-amino acid N-acyltransferase YncA
VSDSPASSNWLIRKAAAADAAGIARVHVDSWRSTYAGIMPDTLLAGMTYADREEMWINRLSNQENPNPLLVAEDAQGRIVGFAAAGPERTSRPDYGAEVYAVYLLEAEQGAGIGKVLFTEAASRLRELGYDSLLVWVARDNPACGFYAALGGVLIDEKEEEYGGRGIKLLAYGWQGLDEFAY